MTTNINNIIRAVKFNAMAFGVSYEEALEIVNNDFLDNKLTKEQKEEVMKGLN